MWKMFSWVGRAIAVGLIASFLSIWTTGYIVNSYVETLLKQYNLPLEVQPFALSGVWGKLWGADPVDQGTSVARGDATEGGWSAGAGIGDEKSDLASVGKSNDDDSTAIGESDGSGGTTDATGGAAEGSTGTKGAANGGETEEEPTGEPLAIDAFGQEEEGAITGSGSGTGPKAEAGGTGAGTEQISGASGQLSGAERDELFDLLATKLPQQAWQSISEYMENGLTDQEVTNIQQIVAQYLSEEQYKTFMSILKKY